jgi:spore maturation protein CgeB
MKRIINLNTPEFPCPGSHYYTATKFCKGFQQNGLEFIELNSIVDIEKYNSCDNIILLSNHFVSLNNKELVYQIGQKLKKCYFIAWHFNFHTDLREKMPFDKYIITGEFYRNKPKSSEIHLEAYNFSNSCGKWLPFVFSSSMHPDEVGSHTRGYIYDSCFIGHYYKLEWINRLNNCYKFFSDANSNFLTEEERLRVYLDSNVCLGFHNDANISNSCVVERVFEGMSLGCAVISDNMAAQECTDGIVKYVGSFEEVNQYIELYKNDKALLKNTQERGYEYVKNEGTYYHQAKKFLNNFENIYN